MGVGKFACAICGREYADAPSAADSVETSWLVERLALAEPRFPDELPTVPGFAHGVVRLVMPVAGAAGAVVDILRVLVDGVPLAGVTAV
jgi:hypothetical protein